MARNSDVNAASRAREMLFVGACAAIFVVIAACAIYTLVRLAI